MTKWMVLLLIAALMTAGCRKLEEEDDSAINDDFTPIASNCNNSPQNAYGCYGGDKEFGNEPLDEGVWSVYAQTFIGTDFDAVFYDAYQFGYRFLNDGTVYERDMTTGAFSIKRLWGIDGDGKSLTIADRGTFTITAQFTNDENCFKVTNDSLEGELKLCHESLNDTSKQNSVGFFGDKVTFGKYTHGDFTAVGAWSIEGYASTQQNKSNVTLGNEGNTSNAKLWGVSDDGKLMRIDDETYLVHKYIQNESCIAVDVLGSDTFSLPKTLKLCKTDEAQTTDDADRNVTSPFPGG